MNNLILKLGKNIFLIDAIGAAFSALLLFVFYLFPEFLQLTNQSLIVLLFYAVGLCIYSSVNYKLARNNYFKPLFLLCLLNAVYIMLTLYFAITQAKAISIFGKVYFGIEIGIILLLIVIEYLLAKRLRTE